MPPKQRQIKIEQKGSLAAIQELESRTDEELARETKHRAAAQALLGARAADRYDADTAAAVKSFLTVSANQGQANLSATGYVPLPDSFKERLLKSVDAIA